MKMVKIGKFLAGTVVTAVLAMTGIVFLFIYAVMGAFFGAVAGWFVQIAPVLGPAVRAGFGQLGFAVTDLTSVGAAIGFVSGFFMGRNKGGNGEW